MAKRNVKVQYDTDTQVLEYKASNGDTFEGSTPSGVTAAITAACAADKAIGAAIINAITAALTAGLTENGAITLAIATGVTAAITQALGEGGAIKAAIDAAVTTG